MSRWGGSERDRERDRANRARELELQRQREAEEREAQLKAQQNQRPTVVQLDGLVLLKIINHSKESMPDVVSGQLLGLDVDQKLEVTNCFPFPSGHSEADGDAYQLEMMRHLRTVNVDNNTVGWYQSAYMGTFFDQGLLDAQYTYQKHIPNSVVVVYDPFQTSKGRLVLKAYRLSDAFMSVYHPSSSRFSFDDLNKLGVESNEIFEQIPIKVHNSHLVHGFLYELREEKARAKSRCEVEKQWSSNLDRLTLSSSAFIDKTLTTLGGVIDTYSNEQGRFQYYLRAAARQRAQQADYYKRRASENAARVEAGKDPLPEEDTSKLAIFKPIPKPSRMETYLTSNQMNYYCESLTNVAKQAFQKLYLIEAGQKKTANIQQLAQAAQGAEQAASSSSQ